MNPATEPRRRPGRLLSIDPAADRWSLGALDALPEHLRPGDLLVVNDAATLPASLHLLAPTGVELRLAAWIDDARWWAVAFGPGDWRQDTDLRPPPPVFREGDVLRISDDLSAAVEAASPRSPRLLRLRFSLRGEALLDALHRRGRPVQYSYLRRPLALHEVRTVFAGRPWAVEMPSAGRALSAGLLRRVRQRGVDLAWLTHAAGLSATGDPALDAQLPLPERYEIPAETVDALDRARARGGRIVAVGTSVVRALESAAATHGGWPQAGAGVAELIIRPPFALQVVDGLLSGMHEVGESHHALLAAVAPAPLLNAANADATAAGLLAHEFGDSTLVLAGAA
ncbi:MAG: S-adenosylmethionine:tRNA ribosyltransferase-isomerase [Alphaproteobacteria bacterium]|nr:S-adenosylmethionine:tRNA ribosyltransferase-isomerase [Alphaproteobacteria bacterium]